MCPSGAAPSVRPTRTVAVLTAGVHEPSTSTSLASALAAALARAAFNAGMDIRPRTVEIRDLATDLGTAMVSGGCSPALMDAIETVTGSDALIAVSPTFASSYAGIFKSFFDVLDPAALLGMPTLLGATGGSVRHSLVIENAMRPLLAYFRAAVVPTGVFATPDELAHGDADPLLGERIDRAGRELAAALGARVGDRYVAGS